MNKIFTPFSTPERAAELPLGRLSLEHMPDPVLLKTISYIPVVTREGRSKDLICKIDSYLPIFTSRGGFLSFIHKISSSLFSVDNGEKAPSFPEIKEAVTSFNALGAVNQNLNRLVKEDYTRAIFVKALIEMCDALEKSTRKEAFSEGLNLDLKALEMGFRLYVEDRNNQFSQVALLDREVNAPATLLFDQAKRVFQEGGSPSIEYKVESFEKRDFKLGIEDFLIHVSFEKVEIFTPFHTIKIKKISSGVRLTERVPHLPILALSEILIDLLGATFEGSSDFVTSKSYYQDHGFSYELPKPHFFNHQIRKIEERDLSRIESKEIEIAKTSQRVIALRKLASCYRIRRIGRRLLHPSESHCLCSEELTRNSLFRVQK